MIARKCSPINSIFLQRKFLLLRGCHTRTKRNKDGKEQLIAFFSAKLNKHQLNYSVTEMECLAAVHVSYYFPTNFSIVPMEAL